MRAALNYNALTGSMTVIRRDSDDKGHIKADTMIVPVATLQRIGDADIDNLVHEAMTFPGREIRMPKFNSTAHRIGGGIKL